MVLKDIMAISGEQGLFRFLAQGKNAIIVEHLETKRRSSAFGSAKVSSLEEISIFAETEDIPLGKVFDLIHEKQNNNPLPDHKADPEILKKWFAEVLPEYDRDKVYISDIRKVVHWYSILYSLDLLVKEEPESKEDVDVAEAAEGSETTADGTGEEITVKKKSQKTTRKSPAVSKSKKVK